ncbi:MAG TPA: hypothetical protein VF457_06125 [Burkholderiaceae bacterium]
MRNVDSLLALRRRGLKPAGLVWVLLAPAPRGDVDLDRHYRDTVLIEPEDAVERLDLRAFVGLDVIVAGSEPGRVHAAFSAFRQHNARRVIANCSRLVRGSGHLDFVLDTAGVLAWHA